MSKITNDGLTWSGAGCVRAVYPYDNSGSQRFDAMTLSISYKEVANDIVTAIEAASSCHCYQNDELG